MTILLTNDDGIEAPGLRALAEALSGLDELLIVAPAKNHSGASQSITVRKPLCAQIYDSFPGAVAAHAVHGSPVDTVKYALRHVCRHSPPRLVVSGINNGANAGLNALYSGTVGAALEAALLGVPAVATSLAAHEVPDWSTAQHFTRQAAELALRLAPAAGRAFCLNLNVPDLPLVQVKGLRFTRHGLSGYAENYIPLVDGPADHYQVAGDIHLTDPDDTFDTAAFQTGWASLTPLQADLTDHELLAHLRANCATPEGRS